MEQLKDVLELILFDMEAHYPFDHLEWSSSQPKPHVPTLHIPFVTSSTRTWFFENIGFLVIIMCIFNMGVFIWSSRQFNYFYDVFHAKIMAISCECDTAAHIGNIMCITMVGVDFTI